MAVPEIPLAFRVGRFETGHINVASQALLFAPESINIFSVLYQAVTERNAIEGGQGAVGNRLHFREFHFRPVILSGALETPHAAGGRLAQRGQVHINHVALLETAQRPEPLIIANWILEPRAKARSLANERTGVLQISFGMYQGGVAGLEQARHRPGC